MQIADERQQHARLELYKTTVRRCRRKIAVQAVCDHFLLIVVLKTLMPAAVIQQLNDHQLGKSHSGLTCAVLVGSRRQQMRGYFFPQRGK